MLRPKKLFVVLVAILNLFILPLNCFANEPQEISPNAEKRTVAILTSGGDAPGMNAIIRSFTKTAISMGMDVVGIKHGYKGLLNKEFIKMTQESVSGISCLGGTILHSSRSAEFNKPEGLKKAVDICKESGISGIVVIGGDGSFRGARALTNAGVSCIGIPGTIDNNIKGTDYTIGFDTAINTTIELIDRVRDTSKSHDRCFVIEVMGENSGNIALYTGIASEATSIIVPEVEYDFHKDVIDKIKKAQEDGETHFIVVVTEGVTNVSKMAEQIEQITGVDTRYIILGHLQRGGAPTLKDRIVATKMGMHAAKLLNEGKSNRIVSQINGKIVDIDINESFTMDKQFDIELYRNFVS